MSGQHFIEFARETERRHLSLTTDASVSSDLRIRLDAEQANDTAVRNERFEKADAGCLSTWVGLVPKQNSSGGKEKLGSISINLRPSSVSRARARTLRSFSRICAFTTMS
nr:transposase [Aminobacter lissarensis]